MNATEPLAEIEARLHVALTLGDADAIAAASTELDALPQPSPVPILSAALYYGQIGLRVFPLSPGSKIPHKGTRGCKDATTDEAQIRAWWERWPDSNVAIATGHTVDVVDIDGPQGQASRAHNWETFQSFQTLGMVLTPRPGGMHIYLPAIPGARNAAGFLPSIDFRAAGGYVCAPPSVTDQGGYRWLRPLNLNGVS